VSERELTDDQLRQIGMIAVDFGAVEFFASDLSS
jgi:uncharacterized protein YjeT (DUF2065 family)